MLTLSSGTFGSRREFLRVGSLALGGLSLPGLLAGRARAAEGGRLTTDRAVVFLFLQGGPSQIEMFDPKMTAPDSIRAIFGEVKTSLPGITFGSTFPKLAARADRVAVVRSFASNNGDHQNYLSVAGGNVLKAPLGTLYARVAGTNHPRTGVPTNVILPPEAVAPDVKLKQNFETQALQKLVAASRTLGASYGFFDPSGGGQLRQNLELKLPRDRFDHRRDLLRQLDGFRRRLEDTHALDDVSAYEQRAYDVIVRGIAHAFDLSKEDPKTIEKYDTSKLFKLEEVTRWGDMRRSSNLLGKQLLLARRLVEAGVSYVAVHTEAKPNGHWDTHNNNFNMLKKLLLPFLDRAVSTLIEDLDARGLLASTLVVVTGDMGRTPRVNKAAGRDHWPQCGFCILAGGGTRPGVIGTSDRQAAYPVEHLVSSGDLAATMYHLMGINPEATVPDQTGRPVHISHGGKVVQKALA